METITTIAGTVVELVKVVLSPLGNLGEFIESIFEVIEGGSSDLSSVENG